jgi:2-oxoglutarate dehydrogenase E2 component (dihydrolipoamide succinyltransferase)
MPQFELILPKMGESVAEATIIKWLKQPGDEIREDEAVVEIATDKVDSEVPSPVSGKLVKFLFNEDDVAQVGDIIALIEIAGSEEQVSAASVEVVQQPADLSEQVEEQEIAKFIPGVEQVNSTPVKEESRSIIQSDSFKFYSPLVKSIAAEEGISNSELDQIQGTGADGRVTKQDLLDYISRRTSTSFFKLEDVESKAFQGEPEQSAQSNSQPEPKESKEQSHTEVKIESDNTPPSFAPTSGTDEIIEMDRMRKLIAEHMISSVQTAPHVTSFVETDVTSLVKWRERNKPSFEKKVGEKITYTPIFIQAVAKAIRDFPMINISLNGTQIIKKADINIGLAAALPNGNLIVPVIKKADQLNLIGLTKAVNDLANRSKNNKLQPDEVKDGTFTITNIGSFGNIMGTPIINQPQVAILAIGAIQKKPAVVETEFGDVIGIRHKMYMSLSYDHRIVDGALGGMFLKKISDYLEAWDLNQEI